MVERAMQMFAIYDLIAGEIVANRVQLYPHVAPARRMFQDQVQQDPKVSAIAAHPSDYALVYLGVVSVNTLMIADVGAGKGTDMHAGNPHVVCTGTEFVSE